MLFRVDWSTATKSQCKILLFDRCGWAVAAFRMSKQEDDSVAYAVVFLAEEDRFFRQERIRQKITEKAISLAEKVFTLSSRELDALRGEN